MTTREAMQEALSVIDDAFKSRCRAVGHEVAISLAARLASGILIARAIEDSGVGAISGELETIACKISNIDAELENITTALRSKSYAERYPPQLDAPVVVEFVPTDEDTVVVEPTCINCGRPNHTFQQMLTCSQVGLDAMRARRRKP